MLIWLVLLHAFVHPGLSAGGEGAIGQRIAQAVCAPQMPCVTDAGCCCEVEPAGNIPVPEPIQGPTRGGVDLIAIPQPGIPALFAEPDAEMPRALPARLIEPESHGRRLSRLCVWRT